MLDELLLVRQAGGEVGRVGLARVAFDPLALDRGAHTLRQRRRGQLGVAEHILRAALQPGQHDADLGRGADDERGRRHGAEVAELADRQRGVEQQRVAGLRSKQGMGLRHVGADLHPEGAERRRFERAEGCVRELHDGKNTQRSREHGVGQRFGRVRRIVYAPGAVMHAALP